MFCLAAMIEALVDVARDTIDEGFDFLPEM
jgi:hypothetical protein